MGDIIADLKRMNKMPVQVFIERRVDDIEIQKLQFTLDKESFISTETGRSITVSGRDENCNRVEISIDISVSELIDALRKVK